MNSNQDPMPKHDSDLKAIIRFVAKLRRYGKEEQRNQEQRKRKSLDDVIQYLMGNPSKAKS